VLEQVQGCISQCIGRAQNRKLAGADHARGTALPEAAGARRGQALQALVPELKVQFDRSRNLQVEEIPAPFPRRFAYHRRQVVRGKAIHAFDRFVAAGQQYVARGVHAFRRTEEVDIVLHPAFAPASK
jgi:hypothetical protein